MISIIGAGPVGNYTAYLLAKKGKNVNVFEEHEKIVNAIIRRDKIGATKALTENII